MKKLILLFVAAFILTGTENIACADSTFATAVVDYSSAPAPSPPAGIFMNWDSTNGFYHNEVSEYPGAGADLDWLLGGVDTTKAAGWGGDANGGTLTLRFDTPFGSDGTGDFDIVIHGFGFAYNTPFSAEKGAVRVSASSDGANWTVISDYAGYDNGPTWEPNPHFQESPPGVPSDSLMLIDLDAINYTSPISYLKFELGDGEIGHGRALFINSVEGGNVNVMPVADAGDNQEVNPGDTVTLDASGSSDSDDGIASYQWVQKDATPSTTVTLDDPTAIYPAFTAPDAPGETLTFELTVTDNAGQTDTDTVEISIAAPAFDITMYYATSVEDESGCVSWSEQTADGGEHALGLPDYVPGSEGDCSGWTENAGHMTLKFKGSITDGDRRDDLIIFHFGQGEAEVSTSEDDVAWTSLGALPAAEDGGETLSHTSYDFSDFGVSSVQYVKILKTGTGQKFIDSVFVPVSVYGAFAEDRDAEYPNGCVDWIAKQADDGKNALGAPDYDDSTPGIGNCSGWMVEAGRLTIGFDKPFFDGTGGDLGLYYFGRGGANVEVSRDGTTWMSLGELPPGINGGSKLDVTYYDFNNFGITSAQYIRINKTQVGFTYGRFIDAVEGVYGIPGSVGAAGRDQTVVEGTPVTIGAPKDSDAIDLNSYRWEQIAGPGVTLSDDSSGNPTFIAPSTGNDDTILEFKLTVTDDHDETEKDEVQITVQDNGFQLSAKETELFAEAEFVFSNRVGANRNGRETCYMGMACEGGSLTYYEARDPDSKLSSDYIEDMNNRPKNLIYGLIAFDVKLSQGSDLAVVTIFLPEPAPAEYKWYKYSETRGWFDFSRDVISSGSGDGAGFSHDRTRITLYITDGGDSDDDRTENGSVKDPSGLADSTTVGSWHDQGGGGGGCFITTSASRGSLMAPQIILFVAALSVIMIIYLRLKQIRLKALTLLPFVVPGLLLLLAQPAAAKPKKAPEKIQAIMIGDRLVDVAYNLGVVPEAMSVRCSMWPMCKELSTASQVLGCPKCIVERIPNIVPDTAKKRGITRIIIEKHPEFCIYKPKVKPVNIVPLLKDMDLTIEYVDFSLGLESAIRQTAKLLGREAKADALINRYRTSLAKAKAALPNAKSGKKVVIISGVYQRATGKSFLRIEAPGGYSDRFLLEPLGCINVGDALKPANTRVDKGHFMIRKLDALAAAKPDVIVMTGDAFAVQKTLSAHVRKNPALAELRAIKNLAIYGLPFYGDSSVIEYPDILRQWAAALAK